VNPEVVRWPRRWAPPCTRVARRQGQARRQVHVAIHYVIGWSPIYGSYDLDLVKGARARRAQRDAVPGTTSSGPRAAAAFVEETDLPILRTLRRLAGAGLWGSLP